MNEEAGFIAAMHAEPTDRTVLLVYADWLDERNDPRGEYLRLLAAEKLDRARLDALRRTLDPIWVHQVTNRRYPIGCRVEIIGGAFPGYEGELVGVCADWQRVIVRATLWGRSVEAEVKLELLERIEPAAGDGK